MGYLTTFYLTVIENDDYIDYKAQIEKIAETNPFSEACKWYKRDVHMKILSKKYPKTLFCLQGEGEDAGDLWKQYWLNGKSQMCKAIITYPDFDKSKLY